MNNNQIGELVCTRISHDIIGNIGAVANAVELLEDGDLDFLDDIKSVLKNSSQTLASRMKFFRMAFGLNNANLDDFDLVKKTAVDYLKTIGNKDFPITLQLEQIVVDNRRLALVMIMVLADILIRGGNISVYQENNTLVAEVDANAKIAVDKLDKMEKIIFSPSYPNDPSLAPLCVLINALSPTNIKIYKNEQKIKLIVIVG